MEKIIKTLAEIDMRSAKIMEAASNEQKDLEQTFAARKSEYQQAAEDQTKKQVEELQIALNQKMKAKLAEQADASIQFLEALDSDFQENHTELASKIFTSIIEV